LLSAPQQLLRLADDAFYHQTGWRQIVHQAGRLAGDHGGSIEVALRARLGIARRLRRQLAQQLQLTTDPALQMAVLQAAAGERRRPDIAIGLTLLPRSVVEGYGGRSQLQVEPLAPQPLWIDTLFVRRRDAHLGASLRAFVDAMAQRPLPQS
jgi:DNA-binding transcriptional LysR family regulator